MNKPTSGDSSEQSSRHPTLKAALENLDLQLEAEIARYQQQQGHTIPQQENQPKPQVNQKISEASISSPTVSPTEKMPEPENSLARPKPTEQRQKDKVEASLERAVTLCQEELSAIESNQLSENEGDEGVSLVHQPPETDREEDSIVYPAVTLPHQYRETSQRRQSQVAQGNHGQRNWTGNLLTPWGIGSLFLFVVASTFLGVALIKPESLGYLGLSRLLNSESSTADRSPAATEPARIDQLLQPPTTKTPNLTEESPLDVSRISTLPSPSPSLRPSLSPSPSSPPSKGTLKATPNPVQVTPDKTDLAKALLPPSLRQISQPVPPSAHKSPSPASKTQSSKPSQTASPPQPATFKKLPPTKLIPNRYYVLVEYTGDRSLKRAQKVMKKAFLIKLPRGIRIQMGMYDRQGDARQLVARLKKQKISAGIYSP